MNYNEIKNKIAQVDADLASLKANKEELEKQLKYDEYPPLKPGDVIFNNDSYYIWIKDDEGNMKYFGTYGRLCNLFTAKCYLEDNRKRVVGNIFYGYNPWSK